MNPFSRRDFIRLGGTGLAGACVLSSFPSSGASSVPKACLDHLAKGASVTTWFQYPRRKDAEYFKNYISESEAVYMRTIGLTHIRLCVAPPIIMDPKTWTMREEMEGYLEKAIERFHRAGLAVIVDLHNVDRAVELDPAWQDAFVRFWTDLSGRLKKYDSNLLIFEMLNEPVFSKRESEWDVFNARLAAAIRKSAPAHSIITSGAGWGGIDGLHRMKLVEDSNIIYSFHSYDPFPFTHQGATWSSEDVKPLRGVPYPSSPEAVAPVVAALEAHPGARRMIERYGKENWNKQKLAEHFKRGIDWGTHNQVPLYCGEFGVFKPHVKPEHRGNWFHDFGEVLGENHIGWAVWGWDESFGLDRKKVGDKVVVDTVVARALGLKVV